eukprot:COSAG02_NODE_5816_length_4017_cov_4.466820_2_plen_389_part_00
MFALCVGADAPLRSTIVEAGPAPEPANGQICVHVAKLVVTANTLTYAVAGKHPVLKYFQNFPVPEGADAATLAMCPAWGTGVVTASKCAELPVGTRIHGYFTFSPFVLLTPSMTSATTFTDVDPRREGIIGAYLSYQTAAHQTFAHLDYDGEDYQMATGVLFGTGWGIAHLAATHEANPTGLVLTSASSRTSCAAAFAAKHDNLSLEIIGITSPPNLVYAQELGLYDTVIAYGDEVSLTRQKVAVADVAGSATVRQSLYQRFGDDIVYYGSVGSSRLEDIGREASIEGLGGTAPEGYLVFAALGHLSEIYGKDEAVRLQATASAAFNDAMKAEFRAKRAYGAEAVKEVFDTMVAGQTHAKTTYVCSMWSETEHEPISESTPAKATARL